MPRALGIVAASAIVLSLPTPAAARGERGATDAQWNHVARCESGGNWHLNTGNGFYGGLQVSARTWTTFGGHRYARRADLASRSEQIDIGNRIYAADGWGPWPTCAPNKTHRRGR